MSLMALFAAGSQNHRVIVESQDFRRHSDCGWSSLKWQNKRWHKTAAIRSLTTALRSMIRVLSIKLLLPLESFAFLVPKVKVFKYNVGSSPGGSHKLWTILDPWTQLIPPNHEIGFNYSYFHKSTHEGTKRKWFFIWVTTRTKGEMKTLPSCAERSNYFTGIGL